MKLQNIYDDIKGGLHFNKFVLDESLFVEYTCPIVDDTIGIWSQADCIIHVLSGKKTWKTQDEEWEAKKGDTIYIRKGAYIVDQHFESDFCMLGFFINEGFVKKLLNDVEGKIPINRKTEFVNFSLKRINHDPMLSGFINSMYPFFGSEEKPANSLLELKLKELIINIISTDYNPELSSYLQSLINGQDSLQNVMEANFMYRLSMKEFAKLANRSLSKFKRDFQDMFGSSPGKWLINRRLEFASNQISTTNNPISQIAYGSGFEDVSHFSYVFKIKYGISPIVYRQKYSILLEVHI